MGKIFLFVILYGTVVEVQPTPSVEVCMQISSQFNENLRVLHEKNGGNPLIIQGKQIAIGDMAFVCSLYPVKPFTGEKPATPL